MANPQIVLCDTNILVELSKRNSDIIYELKAIGSANIAVSAITAGEFIFGALDKADLAKILKALNAITIIQVNESISELAVELVKQYGLSHTLAVPDALIAATALTRKIPLYTLNQKDFRFIPKLQLYS
ncbi:MAG: type II toxin-antitoxin system VapC family toxin [Tunicatimonas sp.]|uniref:type II toxin-antitoxin system VapC family toxin n=1 Tax=Tunicatimonas sp. TaxID=1940096 RepID=UPI003C762DB8